MVCNLIKGKTYLRTELNAIAKTCLIEKIYKYKKQQLYDKIIELQANEDKTKEDKTKEKEKCVTELLQKCNIHSSSVKNDILNIIKNNDNIIVPISTHDVQLPKLVPIIDNSLEIDNFKAFGSFFKKDLLGFINAKKKPTLRAFVAGGYGLKMLFEHQYGIYNEIKTDDIDITISINNTTSTVQSAFNLLMKRCEAFIKSRNDPHNFKIQVINLPTTYNPVLKLKRFHVISISYKKGEFVDLCITDKEINVDEMNKTCSNKCNLPIKNDDGYFKEFFQIIYMENVQGIDKYCYLKRNPVTGKFSCKGVKDIDRVKLLCGISKAKSTQFDEYCKMIQQVDVNKLKKMSQMERDQLFINIRNVI
jgi:hypothetical protein